MSQHDRHRELGRHPFHAYNEWHALHAKLAHLIHADPVEAMRVKADIARLEQSREFLTQREQVMKLVKRLEE